MAVSKRLRFEVFRRDDHACRYCGAMAPDATLTVDHVIPVALGGSDDPSNLVTACKDCNAGKSSASADARHIADVADDALRWATALRAAFDAKLAERDLVRDYLIGFREAWDNWKYGNDEPIPLPSDWERSVEKWYGLGLPLPILTDAIRGAMGKRNLHGAEAEFRYMAGIVWSTISELENQVAATMAVPEKVPAAHPDCTDPWCAVHNGDQTCIQCGQPDCLWQCGWFEGYRACLNSNRHRFDAYDNLANVCDADVIARFETELAEVSSGA